MTSGAATTFFANRETRLDAGGAFTLAVSPAALAGDNSLVVDLYDDARPVHPDGHLGWWRFRTADIGPETHGTVTFRDGLPHVALGDAEPIDRWVNPDPVAFGRLVVIAVLRALTTNAILFVDTSVAVTRDADLAAVRAVWDRDTGRPRYARAGYVLPGDCTVRIVSPNVHVRDAVGNLALEVFRMLRQNGIAAELYADAYNVGLNDFVRRTVQLADDCRPADRLLYFHSTYTPGLEALFEPEVACRIGYFHGVTSPKLLRVFDPELSVICEKAIAQLPLLARFDRLAANSRTSAGWMIEAFGPDTPWTQGRVAVVPPKLVSADAAPAAAAPRPADGPVRLLYVGRVKSHKKVEDLLELLAALLPIQPDAELWIVGDESDKAYRDYLRWVETIKLELPEGRVRWFGSLEQGGLAECYAKASVYVSMSEDEGFCIPVLEAMQHGLPVFAYGLPPVRDLLGDAGIVFVEKDFAHLAAVLDARLGAPRDVAVMVEAGLGRAAEIAARMDGRGFLELLQP